jgi:cytochrome c-type biogenesis protein
MTLPGILGAALAGFLSFISPCVLPLIPAYLSFISGSTALELRSGSSKKKVFASSLAFAGGFTAAFTVLGIVFSGAARLLGGASIWLGTIGGIVVIFLGLNMVFDFLSFLDRDSRLIARFTGGKTHGPAGAFFLGLAFAAGWSPCIGPILASILLYAGREGNALRAALLLLAYSAGFALPFLAAGLFFDRLKPLMAFLARKGGTVRIVSGIILVALGGVMAAGSLGSLTSLAYRLGDGLRSFVEDRAGVSTLVGVLVWTVLAAFVALPALPPRRARLSALRLGIIIVALVLAVMEATGLVSTLGFVASWLGFSGI